MRRLPSVSYLSFPFAVGEQGPASSTRRGHVREQIEQVVFTAPGERLFRPEFGAGAQFLVFEPNSPALEDLARKRLAASLSDALQGEVDPRTIDVDVRRDGETLAILIRYQLAALGEIEEQLFTVEAEGGLSHG